MTPDFGKSMVQAWCDRNDWSDPTRQGLTWWAFEGRSVMPKPLPTEAQPISNAIRGINHLSVTINSFSQAVVQVAQSMAAMRGEPAPALEKSTSLEAAIGRIAPGIPKPIAIARARQFCQAQNRTEAQLIALIDQAQVQMRHGAVCYVKGHRRADWRQTSPAIR